VLHEAIIPRINPLRTYESNLAYAKARRVGGIKWWGVKISELFRKQRCEEYTELWDCSGELVYYKSIMIQERDWFLLHPQSEILRDLGFDREFGKSRKRERRLQRGF
jgi:hypothetical protein